MFRLCREIDCAVSTPPPPPHIVCNVLILAVVVYRIAQLLLPGRRRRRRTLRGRSGRRSRRPRTFFGTLSECGSPHFQKTVRKLSEKCQKSVSHKKLSEMCLKCVRYVSEICQIQNCVRNMSEQIWKSVRNVSDVKNVSENYHTRQQKSV